MTSKERKKLTFIELFLVRDTFYGVFFKPNKHSVIISIIHKCVIRSKFFPLFPEGLNALNAEIPSSPGS